VRIEELSRRLESISGWTLVPVTGLIPTKAFFYLLINKKYPITVSIRKPWEIDFSEQPDIFHDVCGHLPMLTNYKFIKFLTAYSIIALKYIYNDRAVDFLGRLYWYTYEMGLINEEGTCKPYGAAIITSAGEIANVRRADIPKYPFELSHIFSTPYNPYKLQNEYFVINSFDDLFNCIESLEFSLVEHLMLLEEDMTRRKFSLNSPLDF
jgi:phenylalanine-4-hydroxylase